MRAGNRRCRREAQDAKPWQKAQLSQSLNWGDKHPVDTKLHIPPLVLLQTLVQQRMANSQIGKLKNSLRLN